MKRLAIVSALLLAGCGYDGNYRYSCQDPANWNTVECTPPVCHAADYCSRDLVPEEVFNDSLNP
jgi:hypothetical protein